MNIFSIHLICSFQGCFLDNNDCYGKPLCVENSMERKNELYFCCCEGNMCNQNFSWIPQPTTKPTEPSVIHGIHLDQLCSVNFYLKVNLSLVIHL